MTWFILVCVVAAFALLVKAARPNDEPAASGTDVFDRPIIPERPRSHFPHHGLGSKRK